MLIGIVQTTTNSDGSTETSIQRFSYDADGRVLAVNYNGTYYYYLRNAQGDVVKLIDKTGSTVVEYTCDSWGKLLSTTGSLAETFGAEQPFRYRGYVYDEETGWYYLQSRYYNPELGRFISADVYLSTGQGVIGHNSYAYCGNNPIVRQDPSGYDWWHWLIAGAVVAAAAVAVVVTAGGAAAAIGAVAAVASGVSAATTASTVAAGVFIGSATMLAATAWDAVASSSSIEDVLDAGSWGTVAWTAAGELVGGLRAYSMAAYTDSGNDKSCMAIGRQCLRYDYSGHTHAGVSPHIHLLSYNEKGFVNFKAVYDMNWKMIK